MANSALGLPERNQLYKLLQNFICEVSRDRLMVLSKKKDIVIRGLRPDDTVQHHPWAFSIFVELGRGRVIFKAFFSTDVGSVLTGLDAEENADKISLESCHVLFGEFCNLVGGAIKYSFQETFNYFAQSLSGPGRLGLPAKEHRGKNGSEFSFQEMSFTKEQECIWALEWKKQSIICSSLVQIDEEGIAELIREVKEKGITSIQIFEGGDVELF